MTELDAQACIIGAGVAGLAAGRALADRGISFDWFERGSMVGGLWRIDNDNGGTPAYRSLHLNSSRTRSEYPSFPMPADWPDYPSHTLVAQYLQSFAEAFGLLDRITFQTEVTAVEPLPGPGDPGAHGWAVTTSTTGRRTYQHVVIAIGHHGVPSMPTFPGKFDGEVMHSHAYVDPSPFAGRDVVVVGVGNSGMDIACDACRVARSVTLVTRHGVHVLPKYAMGRPIDTLSFETLARLPFAFERFAYQAVVRITVGRPQDRGLPKPDHRLLGAHPTVSAELYDRVGHGDIVMKPGIDRLDGHSVRFVDGSAVPADLLVLATGYRVQFPFLDPEILAAPENQLTAYQRVVPPHRPGLFLVGFIQSVGSGIPLCEYQAEWIADLITGAAALPTEAEMAEWIEADRAQLAKRYVASQRHTMQVDYWRYIHAMRAARRHGRPPQSRAVGTMSGVVRGAAQGASAGASWTGREAARALSSAGRLVPGAGAKGGGAR